MRNLIHLFVAFAMILVASTYGSAQPQSSTRTITGKLSGGNIPLEGASISILYAADSTMLQTVATNNSGQYTLTGVPAGRYLLVADAIGFRKRYSAPFQVTAGAGAYQAGAMDLERSNKELSAVTVTSKRPLIEQRLDKTVVNVEASPSNTGLSALDVLEKSPGITVDKDGNISLKGKQGVLILLDGKPTYLSGADLANVLKNMPSSNLDQLEIMTNPPAKYDASGNSGVINIRTKKMKIKGLNGAVTVGGGMGLRPKSNNSVNLNYRTGKFNVFGSYSHYWNKNSQDLQLVRNFRDGDGHEIQSVFTQQTYIYNNSQSHTFKAGADYDLNRRTTIGVVVNGFFNPRSNNAQSTTRIGQPDGRLDSITVADNTYKSSFQNLGANVNLRHLFDTTGTELTADLDYVQYTSSNDQLFRNLFYGNNWHKTRADEWTKGQLPSDIYIYSMRADYTHPMKGNTKLEAGVKSSYVKTDNDARYCLLDNTTGQWRADVNRSNHFIYKENINAAYINLSKEWNKQWSSQAGLRAENTNADGWQVATGETFQRHYTQLFPTLFIGYKASGKNQLGLSYGRRIERPDYKDMNPFYYFLDKYTYEKGNPYLKPQFSHNIELTHTWNGMLTSSIRYSRTNDIIMQVLEQVDSITTTYQTRRNIATTNSFTASVSANLSVASWWKANIYVQGNHSRFKGVLNGLPLEANGTTFTTNISNQVELKKGWGLELSGFYSSTEIEATMVSRPMGALNLGVSKQVLNKKGTLRLNIRDFLNVQAFRGYSRYQNVDVTIYNQWDNRVVNLSFTYRFSKGSTSSQQRKRGGAGEEQNRVKTDN